MPSDTRPTNALGRRRRGRGRRGGADRARGGRRGGLATVRAGLARLSRLAGQRRTAVGAGLGAAVRGGLGAGIRVARVGVDMASPDGGGGGVT